jgi:hypothetical protein
MNTFVEWFWPLLVSLIASGALWVAGRLTMSSTDIGALVRRYPCPAQRLDGLTFDRVTVHLHPELSDLNRQLQLTITTAGLRLRFRLRALGIPDFLIPWDAIQHVKLVEGTWRDKCVVRLIGREHPIDFSGGDLPAKLRAAWVDPALRSAQPPPRPPRGPWLEHWSALPWTAKLWLLQLALGVVILAIFSAAWVLGLTK